MPDSKLCLVFQSHNPYEYRYPGLKVISREELHLLKALRIAGYSVGVSGPVDQPLHYIGKKGFRDFLADPIYAFILANAVSTLISIPTNIFASWLYDVLKRKPKAGECNIVLEATEYGSTRRCSYTGESLTDERFKRQIHAESAG